MMEIKNEVLNQDKFNGKKRILALSAVALGTFMGPLDSSVVNIALPRISDHYDATIGTVEWVVMSYLLIISSLLLTYGRLGDMYGHKEIYTYGFVLFTVGSLLCALAPTILLLIIFRGVQAIGAGMMMSMGPAIVTNIAPADKRGRYMGIIAISVSVALTTGPVLGGLLTDKFGWQSIFYINLPIGVIGYLWAKRVIPDGDVTKKQSFDIKGAILLFLTLILLLLPLSYTEKVGWKNFYVIASLIISFLLLLFFVYLEKRLREPMIDISVFKNRLFSFGNISALLSYAAMFFVILIMPFYLQQLLNLSPSETGLLFIPMPLTSLIVAPVSGILSDKIDVRLISSFGMGFMSFGLWQLSQLQYDSSNMTIILAMITIGFGSGLFQTPNTSAVMGSVPRNRLGIASSMLATMRNLGMMLGVAIAGAIFTSRYNYLNNNLSEELNHVSIQAKLFIEALNLTFIVASMIALLAVITSLIRGPLKR